MYVPCQHMAYVAGCLKPLVFANVEFYADDPPDVISLGGYTYEIAKKSS